jgi:phospholipase/carboxylesterase
LRFGVAADTGVSVVALHGVALHPGEIDRMVTHIEQRLSSADVRWLFPRAPQRPLTILGGQAALAWYDILGYDRSRMDAAGIEAASEAVTRALREERDRYPGARIALCGFSQGGTLALHVGLKVRGEVDAIVAFASALAFPEEVPEAAPGAPRIFLGHGRLDRIVPYALGYESYEVLRGRGYDVGWHSYWCGHVLPPRTLRHVSSWLRREAPRRRFSLGDRPPEGGLAAA